MSSLRIDRDYATGKAVDLSKPEEPVRQDTEKWLVKELRYEKDKMDIEYRIRVGSRRLKPDITIFRRQRQPNLDQHRDILGLVEIKPDSMEEAEEQLHSYMAVCSACEWGVAATADARQFYRRKSTGEIERIHAIPPHGISINASIRLTKSDLMPAVNLKLHFKSILYHLYSNTNIQSRTRLCNEMTKILFCKIYDEKLDMDVPYFQVLPDKSRPAIKRNIETYLWKPVLRNLVTTGIFQRNERIILDPDSVAYVVGELERLNLSETDCDVIGAAFEVFAERYFVGEKGEFFTPRIAIKNAIKMLSPEYASTILDPACGSGGFLIYALEYIWDTIEATPGGNKEENRKHAPSFIYGIDKEPDLVKVARAYMTLIGDGSTHIVDTDSLKPFEVWDDKARVMLADEEENGQIRQFDFVFTNPPFGSDIKIKHSSVLEKYDLGHRWTKARNSSRWIKSGTTEPTSPQILFLELCVKLLKDGGRMCIVLPEGVLGNVGEGYVRQWLLENTTILAIWDCSALLFQPHTGTKTCILFIEKSQIFDQSIMMSVVSKCGHDQRGAEVRDQNGRLNEDFSKALADWENRPSENHTGDWKGEVSIIVPRNEAIDKNLLIPRIYQLEYELGPTTKTLGQLEQEGVISIKTLTCRVKQSEYDENSEIPYIRTTDLGVMELRPSIHKVPVDVYERERSAQDISPLDILVIKDGTYRIGEPVMLLGDDLNIVVQAHFYKIRVLDDSLLDPYFLVYALKKSQPFIVASSIVQATISSITIARMREIPIPFPDDEQQILIANEMRGILGQRRMNLEKLENL